MIASAHTRTVLWELITDILTERLVIKRSHKKNIVLDIYQYVQAYTYRPVPTCKVSYICRTDNNFPLFIQTTRLTFQTMYVQTWDEFEKAAQTIYLNNPDKARYTQKYIHSKNQLVIKMTDDVSVVQYKTEIAQDVRKVEKFIQNLMRHMTSKTHHDF